MVADEELAEVPVELEPDLPHAARVTASSAQLASTPILFLFTRSPMTGFLDGEQAPAPAQSSAVSSIDGCPVVNISGELGGFSPRLRLQAIAKSWVGVDE